MPTLASCESDQLFQFSRGDAAAREAAFEALFHQHQGEVLGWILRIVRDRAAAEELTIETFWRIYQAHARLDPSRNFSAWARRIATYAALDWLRAHRIETARTVDLAVEPASTEKPDPVVSIETRQRTAQAFTRLRPGLRVAATLAVIEQRPYKEVAEALEISVAAVKVRVVRALRLLRKDLKKQGITS